MTAHEKYCIAKMVHILDNLEHFTISEVISETTQAVDMFEFNNYGIDVSVEKEQALRRLAMSIKAVKAADC